MKKKICLLLALIFVFHIPAYAGENDKFETNYFEAVKEFILDTYKFEVTESDLYSGALNEIFKENPELLEKALLGMTNRLDKFSEYLSQDEYESWITDLSGQFVGIGVSIENRNGKVTVVNPFENSPAEKAGIVAGDVIASVDGENVLGKSMEEIKTLIVGESGTPVTVGVIRNNNETILEFTMLRAAVTQTTVATSLLDDGIGYLNIAQFAETTPADVKKALDTFEKDGVKKLIIDVRNNPGGEKNSVVETLGYFTPKGPVMNLEYKNPEMNETYYSEGKYFGKFEIVILANENSASAAEVFTGTMKDTKTATVIGTTTYGKGTVQTIQGLLTGGALKLTIATYTTANGTQVNKIGIIPDIEVKNKIYPLCENPDAEQMQYAVKIDENSGEEYIKPIEYRLSLLGIYCGNIYDGKIDADTSAAVKIFQEKYGLAPTGEITIDTQVALNNATREIKTVYDKQFETALDFLNQTD